MIPVRRAVRLLIRPFYRLLLRFVPLPEPWARLPDIPVEVHAFGAGSTRPFQWYFDGDCHSRIDSVQELCDWLLACRYVTDQAQFGAVDVWMHPTEFERVRAGDCDDHSLFAWRRLIELGFTATLFSGVWHPESREGTVPHVWVVFTDTDGTDRLLDAACKQPGEMLVRFPAAMGRYTPFFGVDAALHRSCYGGFVHHLRRISIRNSKSD